MKKILLSASLFLGLQTIAQVSDQVSIEPGYTNQSFYSLENGELSNVVNNDWNIAFDVSAFGSAIRINGQLGTELFVVPTDTSTWMTIDTAGIDTWTAVRNSSKSWSGGAFNADFDSSNPSDLGWGVYNSTTHFITGNKLFVIKLDDGSYRKIWIELLASGTYTFKYAGLDNSGAISEMVTKSGFNGKNFVYYSLTNTSTIDREPVSQDWDITFTKYIAELAPNVHYGVTGALLNRGVKAYKDNSVASEDAVFDPSHAFDTDIDVIGYNWKTFSFTSGYVIDDSAAYFIETSEGDVWKLVFTAFGGSSTGDIEFTKEQVSFVGIAEDYANSAIKAYPNPANNQLFIEVDAIGEGVVTMYAMNGKKIMEEMISFDQSAKLLSMDGVNSGIYFLTISMPNGELTTQKIVIKK